MVKAKLFFSGWLGRGWVGISDNHILDLRVGDYRVLYVFWLRLLVISLTCINLVFFIRVTESEAEEIANYHNGAENDQPEEEDCDLGVFYFE